MHQLGVRHLQAEWMDEPGLDPAEHAQALAGLDRINWWSRQVGPIAAEIRRRARDWPGRPIRVLDLACGSGRLVQGLQQQLASERLQIEVDGCDLSPTAVELAHSHAAAAGLPCQFFVHDAIRNQLPADRYDVICHSLFAHHLTVADLAGLLTAMGRAARKLVVVSDLERSTFGYWLAWCGTRILSRSPIVHNDGPMSVEAAFTRSELAQLAKAALPAPCVVKRIWPARLLLVAETE